MSAPSQGEIVVPAASEPAAGGTNGGVRPGEAAGQAGGIATPGIGSPPPATPGSTGTNGGERIDTSADGRGAAPSADDTASASGDARWVKPLRQGDTDAGGGKVTTVFFATRQFFIYEADGQVRYLLPEDYEAARRMRLKIAELGGLRASIEDLRSDPALSQNQRFRAAREMAWALAIAFEDESNPPNEKPKEILARVDARLRSLVKSHYRKKYVLSNLMSFAVIEVLLIAIATLFAYAGDLAVVPRYATYAAFGGLGAFLSVVTGIRSIDFDINLTTWEHVFAGATRILIGVVGAVVVGLALDSRLIDPTFGNSGGPSTANPAGALDHRLALNLIFAFIAGFSESLVPNLLRRGEQAAGAAERQSAPDEPIVKDMKP